MPCSPLGNPILTGLRGQKIYFRILNLQGNKFKSLIGNMPLFPFLTFACDHLMEKSSRITKVLFKEIMKQTLLLS